MAIVPRVLVMTSTLELFTRGRSQRVAGQAVITNMKQMARSVTKV